MSKELTQVETEVSKPSLIEEVPLELENQQEKALLFQAIGTLYGLPERDQEGNFSINLGGQRYHLFILGDRYRPWLKQYETHPDRSCNKSVGPPN